MLQVAFKSSPACLIIIGLIHLQMYFFILLPEPIPRDFPPREPIPCEQGGNTKGTFLPLAFKHGLAALFRDKAPPKAKASGK